MAVPKKRTTKSRRDRRRQHIFLEKPPLTTCKSCGKMILPHTVCTYCGRYREKEVVDVMAKLDKKERKTREKEIKVREKERKEPKKRPLDWKELSKK